MAFNPITSLFGSSPIKPIQQHMQQVINCVSLLERFAEFAVAEKWDKASDCFDTISAIEEEADQLKMELRLNLPKSLFMPISRSDLLQVLHLQDELANKAKDVAGLMLGRKLAPPKAIDKKFVDLIQGAITTSLKAMEAINELDELVETGFAGNEIKIVEKLVKQLNKEEKRLDKAERKIRASLYAIEKDLYPVDVMFLYQLIDTIGSLGDTAQSVGNQLQLIVAR